MSSTPKPIRNRRRAHRGVAFLAISALVLSACTDGAAGNAGMSTPSATVLVKDAKVDLQAVDALLAEVEAFGGLERQARAASLVIAY